MKPVVDSLVAALLVAGSVFVLLAALGLLRMPDPFTRMHVTAKAGTLGISLMVLAVAAFFAEPGIQVRALLVVVFFFLTAPVASHMLARAAYMLRVPMWERTLCDDARGRYNLEQHRLAGHPCAQKRAPAPDAQKD